MNTNEYQDVLSWLNNPAMILIAAKVGTDLLRIRFKRMDGKNTLLVALLLSLFFSFLAAIVEWRVNQVEDLILHFTVALIKGLIGFGGAFLLTEGQKGANNQRWEERSKEFEDDHILGLDEYRETVVMDSNNKVGKQE